MAERFEWVGVVSKVRPGSRHVVGEVPGKVALVIADEELGECLGYFPRARRPRIGVRIGVRGPYVAMEVPLERIPPDEREGLFGGTPMQHQLDVEDWEEVDDDFDPLLD